MWLLSKKDIIITVKDTWDKHDELSDKEEIGE